MFYLYAQLQNKVISEIQRGEEETKCIVLVIRAEKKSVFLI